tara:strand:+ start:145 stop:570 length:426 start_codon:yes stop_codon:yes gene_type:complete
MAQDCINNKSDKIINNSQNLPIGMSIAAMTLGIISLLTLGSLSPVGLIISILAFKKCQRGITNGRGMAIAGIVTNIIGFIPFIVIFFFFAVNIAIMDFTSDAINGVDGLVNNFLIGSVCLSIIILGTLFYFILLCVILFRK